MDENEELTTKISAGEELPAEKKADADEQQSFNVGEQSAEQNAREAVVEDGISAESTADAATQTAGQTEGQTAVPAQPPKRKKSSRIFWNILLVIVIGLGIYSLFEIVGLINTDESASFGDVMKGLDPLFAFIFVMAVVLVMVLDCSKFCIISKTVTGKVRLSSSIKTSFLGKYYDAVTPFGTGGQPMQIYYLTTKGISGGNASAMVFIRYFSSILTWIILGAGLMIAGTAMGVLDNVSIGSGSARTLLLVAGWVGIGVNLIIPIFVTLFLLFPKLMYKLTSGFVKLGAKIKIVKDVDKTTARAIKVVDDFKNSFKVMATSPLHLIILLLVSFAEAALTFSIPFFAMQALSCDVGGKFIDIMALNAFTTFGVSFIPTPGNSGVIEGAGGLAFSFVAKATLAWSVLFWRLGVYYIYIIIGIVMTIADMIRKSVKNKKALKM